MVLPPASSRRTSRNGTTGCSCRNSKMHHSSQGCTCVPANTSALQMQSPVSYSPDLFLQMFQSQHWKSNYFYMYSKLGNMWHLPERKGLKNVYSTLSKLFQSCRVKNSIFFHRNIVTWAKGMFQHEQALAGKTEFAGWHCLTLSYHSDVTYIESIFFSSW